MNPRVHVKYGLSYGISPNPRTWDANEEIVFFSQAEVNWMRNVRLDQESFRYCWLAKKEDPRAEIVLDSGLKWCKEIFEPSAEPTPASAPPRADKDTWACRDGGPQKHFFNPHAASIASQYAPSILAMLRGRAIEIRGDGNDPPMLQSDTPTVAIKEPEHGTLSRQPEEPQFQPLLPSLA